MAAEVVRSHHRVAAAGFRARAGLLEPPDVRTADLQRDNGIIGRFGPPTLAAVGGPIELPGRCKHDVGIVRMDRNQAWPENLTIALP